MMAKKKPKDRPSPKKKKFTLQLTRRGVLLWVGLLTIVSAWMFALGILVGRETVPLKFDIKQLEKKLAALKDADIRKELRRFRIDKNPDNEKPDFGFYEALKVEKEDIRLPAKPGKEKEHPLPSEVKAEKTKKKKSEKPKEIAKNTVSDSRKARPSTTKLTVQVASVKNVQDAGKLIIILKKKGFPAYMSPATIPGKGIWYRVRVGSYEDKTQANRTLNKLKKQKYKGIIIKY